MASSAGVRWRVVGIVARVFAGLEYRRAQQRRPRIGGVCRIRTINEHSVSRGTHVTTHAQFLCVKGSEMKQPNDVFNDFQARMSELFKNSPAKDVQRNVRAMLSQGFSKLHLLTP